MSELEQVLNELKKVFLREASASCYFKEEARTDDGKEYWEGLENNWLKAVKLVDEALESAGNLARRGSNELDTPR